MAFYFKIEYVKGNGCTVNVGILQWIKRIEKKIVKKVLFFFILGLGWLQKLYKASSKYHK